MEIRHLKYFLAVAEELNFTRAAKKLFIAQPPLSRQIKELEKELGAQLFNRNNKRVELTEAGIYFRSEVTALLQQLEKVKSIAQKIATNVSGEFRIGYISSTFSGTISTLLQHLTNLYPYVHFKLFELPTIQQIKALEVGNLDLGILRGPLLSPNIETTRWFKDGYALVYNPQLQTIDNESSIKYLAKATFVFFNKNYAPQYYHSLLAICAQFGFVPNVVHESNNVHSIIQLVRKGLGVSILPASIAANHAFPEIRFLPLKSVDLFTEVLLTTPKGQTSEITEVAIEQLLGLKKKTIT